MRALGHQFGSDAICGDQSTPNISVSPAIVRAAFLLRCSRPCLLLRGLLPRKLWRFGVPMLNYLGFADASLVSASNIPVRGSQIGKTKLSVRKAEERP